jgi:hypothetical protein
MAVVKLFVGGVTFNVRPSSSAARPQPAALQAAQPLGAAAAALAAGALPSPVGSRLGSNIRSTSSIGASSLSTREDEQQQAAPDTGSSSQRSALSSSTLSSSSSSSSSSVGSALSTVSAGDAVTVPSSSRNGRSAVAAAAADGPADVLTMVSLSWDGEQLYEYGQQQQQQYEGDEGPAPSQTAAALRASKAQQQQWQLRQPQRDAAASPTAAAYRGVAEEATFGEECSLLADCSMDAALASTGSLFAAPGSSCSASSVSCLSPELRQLLADSISFNSTASIRLVPQEQGEAAAGADGQPPGADSDSGSSSNGRQLDRSGNRTECALLEFGGRLSGRLLPGAGSSAQQLRVLQVCAAAHCTRACLIKWEGS